MMLFDSAEIVGGYSGVIPSTRANEVATLFELAIKHELPFNAGLLYCDLIYLVYGKELTGTKNPINEKGENENE